MFSVFVGPYPPKVLRCGTLIFCAISTIGSSEIHGNHLLSIYSDRGPSVLGLVIYQASVTAKRLDH